MAGVPDLSRMRNEYTAGRLREEDLAPTWVEQFDRWFADVVAAELPEPNAVVVATADADGTRPRRLRNSVSVGAPRSWTSTSRSTSAACTSSSRPSTASRALWSTS